MSTIVNSAVANTFFRTNGAAISATTQPNNGRTRAAGPGDSTANAKALVSLPTDDDMPEHYTVSRDITFPIDTLTSDDLIGGEGYALSGTVDNGTTYTSDVGDAEPLLLAGATAGDMVFIAGYFTELVSYGLDTITYKEIPLAVGSVNGSTLYVLKRDVFKQHRGDIVLGYTTSLGGVANLAISGGASTPNRGVNSTEVIRTRRTATAIKAGYWNEFTGEFSVAPTVNDDSSDLTITADKAYSTSRITFMIGKTPSQATR